MKILANAKINLTLDILYKREDGYHQIDSVMQSIGLYDEVSVEKSDKISVVSDDPALCGEKNSGYIAARNFLRFTKINSGAEINIKKNIPLRAGLGGPSADAAAVICALDKMYNTGLDYESLIKIAKSVGADVPFCLFGGTARVGGIGEKVEPMPIFSDHYAVLFKDGEKSSTKEMYDKADLRVKKHNFTKNFISDLVQGKKPSSFANDFILGDEHFLAFSWLKEAGAEIVNLSGSGPFVYGVFNSYDKAQSAKEFLSEKTKDVYLAPFAEQGLTFE